MGVHEHEGGSWGFVTALSDGDFAAFIPLLEVFPEYHGQGVGSELVTRLLARPLSRPLLRGPRS